MRGTLESSCGRTQTHCRDRAQAGPLTHTLPVFLNLGSLERAFSSSETTLAAVIFK